MIFLNAETAAKILADSCAAIWIVGLIGSGALVGVFWKMKGGWGPQNLRAVGLVQGDSEIGLGGLGW
jgi:hypothetical protein